MKRILEYYIEAKDDGLSVRRFLELKGYSHAVLVQLKKTAQGILVNGSWYYVSDILHTGDRLTVTLLEDTENPQLLPIPLPLSILYEDEDILVVDKAAGMPVHPSQNNYDNTLANAVMYYFKEQQIPYTFRCVNRLDRDTTGLTILAKHSLSSAVLSRQMIKRQIHRTYLAIVDGKTPLFGTIDAPIGRKEGSTIERTVDFRNGETRRDALPAARLPGRFVAACPAVRNRTDSPDPGPHEAYSPSSDRGLSLSPGYVPDTKTGAPLLAAGICPSGYRAAL